MKVHKLLKDSGWLNAPEDCLRHMHPSYTNANDFLGDVSACFLTKTCMGTHHCFSIFQTFNMTFGNFTSKTAEILQPTTKYKRTMSWDDKLKVKHPEVKR